MRVMRNVGNHWYGLIGAAGIRGDQDNPDQRRIHHGQVVIADGLTVPSQVAAIIEHPLHDIESVLVDVLFIRARRAAAFSAAFWPRQTL